MTPSEKSAIKAPRSDLLDELTAMTGCEFLSDLPQMKWRQAVCQALGKIDPEGFTLQAWQDSVAYFCREGLPFHTAAEARDALLSALKSNR